MIQDNVRKMPSTASDTDAKYERLIENSKKIFSLQDTDQNNNSVEETCKVFGNVFDALVWLTKSGDKILMESFQARNAINKDSITHCMQCPVKTNIFITGSLYLVGLSLKVLNFKI
jgi:hypothetical protein